MRRKWLVWGGVALVFALLGIFAGMQRWQSEAPDNQAVQRLLAQDFPTLYGERQPMEIYRGKPLVINFWATWCSPCVEEMPELEALQKKLRNQHTQVIGLGVDSAEKMRDFAEKHGITYPLYVVGVPGVELSRLFGNTAGGLPFTILIDAKGVARKTYLGRLDMEELRSDLASL
jgi:thiol-disulfide isomerase/thioredoxin